MAKKKNQEPQAVPVLLDRHAFDHLSKEERFLLFVVPAMGAARASRCVTLDVAKVKVIWEEFSNTPTPVNLLD